MNLEEQNKFSEELERFLTKKLKDNEFHVLISVAWDRNGFSLSKSTLDEDSAFQNCDLVVSGVVDETERLLNRFKIPSGTRFKKPIEQKG